MDRDSCFQQSRQEETVRILGEDPPQKVDAHVAFPLVECLLCTCFCTFFASMLGFALEEGERETRRKRPCVRKCVKECRKQAHRAVHHQQQKVVVQTPKLIPVARAVSPVARPAVPGGFIFHQG